MGYESRIYIVRKYYDSFGHDIDKSFADILMVFNLGKVSWRLEEWYRRQKPTDSYIYADDGNTVLLEDRCGDPLREISLLKLKEALSIEMATYCYDDSVWCCIKALDTLLEIHGSSDERIVCLHYGY